MGIYLVRYSSMQTVSNYVVLFKLIFVCLQRLTSCAHLCFQLEFVMCCDSAQLIIPRLLQSYHVDTDAESWTFFTQTRGISFPH